jgi:SAM-dependent methyltransferase
MRSMKLPNRRNIRATTFEDPLKYYYLPVLGSFFRRRLEFGLELLGPGPYGRVLEIGYGSGILFPELLDRAETVVGIDNHRRPELVTEMMAREGIDAAVAVGDILNLSFPPESFDAVVCLSVLEHIRDLQRAIGEICAILRPGGPLVMGVPNDNRFMMNMLTLIGAPCIDERHVSGPRDVRDAVTGRMTIVEEKWFPGWLPVDRSLYTVIKAVKEVPE